jgi:hypothetical protein
MLFLRAIGGKLRIRGVPQVDAAEQLLGPRGRAQLWLRSRRSGAVEQNAVARLRELAALS